ncbi:hypothetical protein M1N47_04760 [Dehalococcoidia bacterium]|nr:hypothetical protein [Dehalococcoidia bacterium]
MKGPSIVDLFCHSLKANYEASTLTVEKIGAEFSSVIIAEALLGQRLLGEKFVAVCLPYRELRGFHHVCDSGRLTIGFDRSDVAWQQLQTKLHELGEHVLRRLSTAWPDYGEGLRYLQRVRGDSLADGFADSVLAKLMPIHWEVTQRMLTIRLGLNLVAMFYSTWLQAVECLSPGSSRYFPSALLVMPARLDAELVALYQRTTEYVLLQERENFMPDKEILNENCPVCRTMLLNSRNKGR